MDGNERSLNLLHLRKTFSNYLKSSSAGSRNAASFDIFLPLFNKIMSNFTPEELVAQFKEITLFCTQIAEIIVHEIRQHANREDTKEASLSVYDFLRPHSDSRGWNLLKSTIYIVNSGSTKILESICKALLPSTLVKVFYLFFDLPTPGSDEERDARRQLYDSLVMLMITLCSHTVVAEELIKKDDLVLLFVGASTICSTEHTIWRDANFTFLCTIVGKAMSPQIARYIHTKGCVGQYVKNMRGDLIEHGERTVLLCNLLDLLRSSADNTLVLIEDFAAADGYQFVVECCKTANDSEQILHALTGLITAGNETIQITPPAISLSFYNYKIGQIVSRSTATVRIPSAYMVLEKCFYDGNDNLCELVLRVVRHLYRAEKTNYFIVDKYYSLYLFIERMAVKAPKIQNDLLDILEMILRDLNFVPLKELTALNVHLRNSLTKRDFDSMKRFLNFLFRILPINIALKDVYRELLILEAFLNIVQEFCANLNTSDSLEQETRQMAIDLLVTATKGNVQNAQFVIENMDMRMIKLILTAPSTCAILQELRTATIVLIKNLLYLAKNEQLFSSILQLLFSDPGNTTLCTVILKLFVSVLLENHKVRVMFRRSGGYICLMTLLLHLENALRPASGDVALPEFLRDKKPLLAYISLIFQVLTVSTRFEPSNAKYFLAEVRPSIINSILRSLGCFNHQTRVDVQYRDIWERVVLANVADKLEICHTVFKSGERFLESDCFEGYSQMPTTLFGALYMLRLLLDLAFDNHENHLNDLTWAGEEWLKSAENLETIPLLSWSSTVLVHPTAILSLLQLLPSISSTIDQQAIGSDGSQKDSFSEKMKGLAVSDSQMAPYQLDEWSATTQFYVALVLKAVLRSERNQQIMCQYDMPKLLLEVGGELFKQDGQHPILAPFHYLFERLACQFLHPNELRRFLRLDQPLCCSNLDDDCVEDHGGGPVPIHRVKALVSMITPRNHSLANPPAFVEFDLSIEGFACLFIPSLINTGGTSPGGQSTISSTVSSDRTFPPSNGFTFLTWLYVDDLSSHAAPAPSDPQQIPLLTVIRNFEGTEAGIHRYETGPILENHLTCFKVLLNMAERVLLVCIAEHSVVDELRKDFIRPPETIVRVPLSEQFFQTKRWTHIAIVVSRTTFLKQQVQIEILVNGRALANQSLATPTSSGASGNANNGTNHTVHALLGTPPFFRRTTNLRWRVASLYLVEDALHIENIRQIIQLGIAYIGNFQTSVDGAVPVSEDKILLSLNASAIAEINAQTLKSMARRSDCDLTAALLGISVNDVSTPLRILWNIAPPQSVSLGQQRSLGAIVVGYLGMRSFSPCPVSALLDSIGGLSPLFGLIVMCNDSHSLYASLKVLVSALATNRSIACSIQRTRGYQTLAMLLEEKSKLINAHILHLILSLAGTVDDAKENVLIPNLQTFDDLLCDLDVWRNASDEVRRLLFEHFFELVIDNNCDNLTKVRASSLLDRLLIFVFENSSDFPVRNDIVFRLIGAIVQPPCDSTSLLRLGQTISATINLDADELRYPFHISELERLLIADQDRRKDDQIEDPILYGIHLRNRLLNILSTTLLHSSGQVNSQLVTEIVSTLGYGWIFALCAPQVHTGTIFLAMRILVNILRYPSLLEKFREGGSNGGWLTNADSIIRNRAAVLLGFSVAAGAGSVGSQVDVNPELSHCSGFAALENVAFAHADKPFMYLAMLSALFQQPNTNIQPVEEFTVDLVWSHVFVLNEKSSVAHAIDAVQFCADAVVPLLAMVRAGLQRQSLGEADPQHWSHKYPAMLLQLFTFLYQNSAHFFAICHTETFVISLFSALIPFVQQQSQTNGSPSSKDLAADGVEQKNAFSNHQTFSRSGRQALEFLTTVFLNDLCLDHEGRSPDCLFDTLVEFLDGGGAMHGQQSVVFTELVNGCLDQLLASKIFFSNSAASPVPPSARAQLSPTSEGTALNIVAFLSRIIDSVWSYLYRGNPIRILKCFLKLLAEAHASHKSTVQLATTDAHVQALFRIVMYLLSRPIDNIDTQMSVLDTLAEIVRNQHLLLAPNSASPLFYGALVHLVFMLSDRPDIHHHGDQQNPHLERNTAQVSICAQTVWGILWQQKKPILEEVFKREVDLDLYTARATCGEQANRCWLQFVDLQTDCSHSSQQNSTARSTTASAIARNVLQQQFPSKLTKVARTGFQRLTSKKSILNAIAGGNSTPIPQILHYERLRIEPETFYIWIRVHISLIKELIRTQCERYHEWHCHVRKWCMYEWHGMESELTRERGLWGPERGSRLDKFELDTTEGPCRIRKKLVLDPEFYQRYPYRPYLDQPEAKALRAKVAISRDSKLFYERMRKCRPETLDERIIDKSASVIQQQSQQLAHQDTVTSIDKFDPSAELNLSMIKRMVKKSVINEKQKGGNDVAEKEKIEEDEAGEEAEEDEENASDLVGEGAEKSDKDSTALSEGDNAKTVDSSASLTSSSQNNSAKETATKSPTGTPTKKKDLSSVGTGPDNQTLLRLLEQGEQLHSMFRCARVQGLDTMEGLLLFGREHFYVVDGFTLLKTREIRDLDFLPEQFHDPVVPYMAMGCKGRPTNQRTGRQCNKFGYDDIREVHKRRYLLQPIALEIFSADGRNLLLAFPRKIRDRVSQKLVVMSKKVSNDMAQFIADQKKLLPIESGRLINSLIGQQSITQKWQRGEISNFNYLMHLNTLAGRSYNDLSQYPVFPWILRDYDSDWLDLTDTMTFRDLSKPMGAQSPERLAQFLKRYREWDDPTGDTPPYMYGTHYSSAMIVLSYLVRLEPFTQQFLKLQGGHFDLADRMFHSIRDAFLSASRNNMADVKELIPEFFYLPEMLQNTNNFDLGVKQSGVQLHDIDLPKWAHNDPHEFVRLHRQALECDYVSEHLHEWIDLIFGYKQSGEFAKEAHNVFHHLFYEENVDFDSIEDPLTRNATLGFINNFGQIPAQLFKKPHPQRKVNSSVTANPGFYTIVPGVTSQRLFYHCLGSLNVVPKPVKELKAAIGDIVVNEKNQVVVLEQNKVLLPPTSYLSWGFHDRSIRLGTVGVDKSTCILETNDVYEVTCMATTDGKTIFAGLTTGTVLVLGLGTSANATNSASQSGTSRLFNTSSTSRLRTKRSLDAHSDIVTSLAVCATHNFLVSGGRDATAILWHLTQHIFIRQLRGHPGPVTAVAINETKGDVATASNALLFLWTLNGVPLAVVNTSADSGLFSNPSNVILCISFSTINEWDAHNVVMCGTSDGLVKVYSCEFKKDSNPKVGTKIECTRKDSQDPKSVKEHLLKRQQKIQSHHFSKLAKSVEHTAISSQDSQASSPLQTPSVHGHTSPPVFSPASPVCAEESNSQQNTATAAGQSQEFEGGKLNGHSEGRNTLRLRRILSEHTAFNQDNLHPAPITSVRATRDHKSLLVGDGVGRVWMWVIPGQSSDSAGNGGCDANNSPIGAKR